MDTVTQDLLQIPPHVKNLTDQSFGQLTVISFAGIRRYSHQGYALWKCQGVCGREKVIIATSLRSGASQSCGCRIGREKTFLAILRASCPKEYRIWVAMRGRCTNPRAAYFHRYGGRGITVCPQWSTFSQFISDMRLCPGDGYSIERRDNNGDYEPSNCYWATQFEQIRNVSRNINITYNDETHCLKDWSILTGIPLGSLIYRYKNEWTLENVFSRKRFKSWSNKPSPVRYITFNKQCQRWIVKIYMNGNQVYIGRYKSQLEAAEAAQSARERFSTSLESPEEEQK